MWVSLLNVVLARMHDSDSGPGPGAGAGAGSLPEPDDIARSHSDQLCELLSHRITVNGGRLSFADYMTQALYEPGLGYYMAGSAKFGADGDFITAPELTPLFGATLGREAKRVLDATGGGILELGAGSGRLATGLLKSFGQHLIDYTILEPSAELSQRQQQFLKAELTDDQFARVSWVDSLPSGFKGFIIANEVMDALPVERFQVEEAVMQLCVNSNLQPKLCKAPESLVRAVKAIEADLGREIESGYLSEVCLLLEPWIASLADALDEGVVLLIDYGYPRKEFYSQERRAGTLSCYYRHRAHDDAFLWPGLQDITAHVDFTAVVESAVKNDLELLGYASQAAFLLDNGLLEIMEEQLGSLEGESDRIELSRMIKTLTLPGEMGERFQVMALGKRYDPPLQGFRSQDLAYRL
ncbi:MAG: SAM-dependent MidA family methyltransferase [Patiriisocius sp.]|jgi:SAM-dependent MidA family methyltransferase